VSHLYNITYFYVFQGVKKDYFCNNLGFFVEKNDFNKIIDINKSKMNVRNRLKYKPSPWWGRWICRRQRRMRGVDDGNIFSVNLPHLIRLVTLGTFPVKGKAIC